MDKQSVRSRIIERFGSQANFAQMMRLDETVVSRIINGRRQLKEEDVLLWSRVLDLDPSVIEQKGE